MDIIHRYPRVPYWRLARVHKWLAGSEWMRQQPLEVERRFWYGMLFFRERLAYGRRATCGFRPDSGAGEKGTACE